MSIGSSKLFYWSTDSLMQVIYALNTKNDENEAIVASINEQHEERIRQLLAETKDKVDYYRFESFKPVSN